MKRKLSFNFFANLNFFSRARQKIDFLALFGKVLELEPKVGSAIVEQI
jgi:hypothetical protein